MCWRETESDTFDVLLPQLLYVLIIHQCRFAVCFNRCKSLTKSSQVSRQGWKHCVMIAEIVLMHVSYSIFNAVLNATCILIFHVRIYILIFMHIIYIYTSAKIRGLFFWPKPPLMVLCPLGAATVITQWKPWHRRQSPLWGHHPCFAWNTFLFVYLPCSDISL